MKYEDLLKMLKKRETKKLANNTYIVRKEANVLAIRLHSTDILTYHPDGRIVVDSGGYKRVTTKARINEYLGGGRPSISQRQGVWYWEHFQNGTWTCTSVCSRMGI